MELTSFTFAFKSECNPFVRASNRKIFSLSYTEPLKSVILRLDRSIHSSHSFCHTPSPPKLSYSGLTGVSIRYYILMDSRLRGNDRVGRCHTPSPKIVIPHLMRNPVINKTSLFLDTGVKHQYDKWWVSFRPLKLSCRATIQHSGKTQCLYKK